MLVNEVSISSKSQLRSTLICCTNADAASEIKLQGTNFSLFLYSGIPDKVIRKVKIKLGKEPASIFNGGKKC